MTINEGGRVYHVGYEIFFVDFWVIILCEAIKPFFTIENL